MTKTERLFKSMENDKKTIIGYLMVEDDVSLEIFNEDILKKIYGTHNIFMFIFDDEIYYITYSTGLMSLGAFTIKAFVRGQSDYHVMSYETGDYYLEIVDLLTGDVNILQCIADDIINEFGCTTNIYTQAIDNMKSLQLIFDDTNDMKTIIDRLQMDDL